MYSPLSFLINIIILARIQTSYVSVDPKKRRELGPPRSVCEEVSGSPGAATGTTSASTGTPTMPLQLMESSLPVVAEPESSPVHHPVTPQKDLSNPVASTQLMKTSDGSLRRARIVITVKRTATYKKWLEDNPLQDAQHYDDHL